MLFMLTLYEKNINNISKCWILHYKIFAGFKTIFLCLIEKIYDFVQFMYRTIKRMYILDSFVWE